MDKARSLAEQKKVSNLAEFRYQSFLEESFDLTFTKGGVRYFPTLIVLYMTCDALAMVEHKIKEYLRLAKSQGIKVKVVTNVFIIKGWTPVQTSDKKNIYVYNYTSCFHEVQ